MKTRHWLPLAVLIGLTGVILGWPYLRSTQQSPTRCLRLPSATSHPRSQRQAV